MLLNNYLEVAGIIPLVIFRVKKEPLKYLFLTVSKSLLMIILGLVFMISFEQGILGRYLGILYPNIAFIIIYIFILKNKLTLGIDFRLLKQGLKYSLPIIPAAFAATAMSSLDKIMIERFLTIKDIAIYSIGVSVGSTILIITRGFYLAIEPTIFENYDKRNFASLVIKYKIIFVYIINLYGCSLIIFSKEIIGLLVTNEYYGSQIIIPFIVVSCVFRGSQIVVDTTLYALNKTMYHPLIVTTGLVINFIGNILLLPRLGIIGAAISSMISFWVLYMFSVYITKKFIVINWKSFYVSSFIILTSLFSTIVSYTSMSKSILTICIKASGFFALAIITYLLIINLLRNE